MKLRVTPFVLEGLYFKNVHKLPSIGVERFISKAISLIIVCFYSLLCITITLNHVSASIAYIKQGWEYGGHSGQ